MIALVIGLVVAMTGSATAATLIGSKQIKRNAVGAKHLKNGAVGPKQIKNRAVNGKKIKAKAIKPGHLSPKAKNALAGNDGAPGADGLDGVSGHEIVKSDRVTLQPAESKRVIAQCPDRKKVVGGGMTYTGPYVGTYSHPRPTDDGTGWQATFYNNKEFPAFPQVQAICITAN